MPIQILIIDDDRDDVVLARALLGEGMTEPFEVSSAESLSAGRAALLRNEHDVALVDYRLGGDTGLDLLRETKHLVSRVPIIVLTGIDDPAIDLEAMRAGATDYLRKDELTASVLERSIRYAIQNRKLERQRVRLVRETTARRAAEAANAAKDNFLALLSHELRTPLNAIANWVQLLELDGPETLDKATLADAIDAIGRNVRLQAQLVDDLLDVSRIVAGKLDLKREPADLPRICADALEGCRPLATTKRITLHTDFPDDNVFAEFMGDPTRLQQIVWNLANNAVKFTQQGGRVDVSLSAEPAGIVIVVRDNGPGIADEDLPFIFDRFRQGTRDDDSETRNQPAGLGIG
ncbi:MAG: hybrid sensor histidine kinase/response regulator, partial [Planctomycetota bacterium]